jgi:hypothetical protein
MGQNCWQLVHCFVILLFTFKNYISQQNCSRCEETGGHQYIQWPLWITCTYIYALYEL